MPRKPIVRWKDNYYHIMARSNNREFFYLPQEIIWNIFVGELAKLEKEFSVIIASFVLMNNHFHLLILTPQQEIDKIMYFFMKRTTLEIQRLSGRVNKIFGGRYKGSIIKNYSYLVNVYKYICLNPVKAAITTKAEYYPYSTLFYKYKSSTSLPFSVKEIIPPVAFENYEDLDELKWINLGYSEDEEWSIRSGIARTTFEFAKNNSTGKRIIPEIRSPKKKTIEELWSDLFPEETTLQLSHTFLG